MDPELEAAHAARVPYLEPTDLRDPEGRRQRVPEETPLQDSYATQVYIQGGELVRPLPGPAAAPDADQRAARWIVTGWNADGVACTYKRQRRANDRLRRRVLDSGGQIVAEGATAAPMRAWVEDHLVVTGLPAEVVVRLGLEAGQPAVVRWTDAALTIVPTGLRNDVEQFSLPFVVEPVPTTCPMRTDGVPGALCAMRGGPWISASIHAAAIWQAQRLLLLDRFPCESCGGGTLPVLGPPGRAISLGGLVLPSRSEGWAWN